jgi:hypothetical protein
MVEVTVGEFKSEPFYYTNHSRCLLFSFITRLSLLNISVRCGTEIVLNALKIRHVWLRFLITIDYD